MSDQSQTIAMTQTGYDALVVELQELTDVKIPTAIKRLSLARSHGDLSENAEYHAAKEDLAFLEGRKDELDVLIQRAEVIRSEDIAPGFIGMGSQVIVDIGGKGKPHTFHIVGEWEADPSQKKISSKSPLGEALVGKKAGDSVEVEVPAGKVIYSIQEVK